MVSSEVATAVSTVVGDKLGKYLEHHPRKPAAKGLGERRPAAPGPGESPGWERVDRGRVEIAENVRRELAQLRRAAKVSAGQLCQLCQLLEIRDSRQLLDERTWRDRRGRPSPGTARYAFCTTCPMSRSARTW